MWHCVLVGLLPFWRIATTLIPDGDRGLGQKRRKVMGWKGPRVTFGVQTCNELILISTFGMDKYVFGTDNACVPCNLLIIYIVDDCQVNNQRMLSHVVILFTIIIMNTMCGKKFTPHLYIIRVMYTEHFLSSVWRPASKMCHQMSGFVFGRCQYSIYLGQH